MNMIKYRIFIICHFFILTSGWSQEPLRFSLKQAEDLAVQNNFELNASLHRLEQGFYGYQASKAYFKPKIDVAATLDFTRDNRSLQGVIRVTRPIFDRVACYSMKEAQIQWEIARIKVRQEICDLLYRVRNAYYTVLLHQAHLEVDQMIIRIWEDELKRQQRQCELGACIPFEVNQTNLHLKRAWVDYYSTQSEMKNSQIKFLLVLGLSPNLEFQFMEKEILLPLLEGLKSNVNEWKSLTFQLRPQLQQEQLTYLLSQNKISQTKAENLPTLNFYANAGHNYVNNGFDKQPIVGAGVNLDWSLYDPSRRERIRQAREGSREAASNYFQVELDTESMIYRYINEIEKSHLAYSAAQEGALLAEEGIKMATKKHQLGMMSAFEYRDVVKSLHAAQQEVNQAKFDVRDTYEQFIQQVGLDLKE